MNISIITTHPLLEEHSRLIQEFEGLGHKATLVDWSSFTYSIEAGSVNYPHKDIVEESDLVFVRGVFKSGKMIASILRNLRESGISLFDNHFADAPYSIDKSTDLLILGQSGVRVPNTYIFKTFENMSIHLNSSSYPLIIKSPRMGKGAGVFKFDSIEESAAYVKEREQAGAEAKSYLVQEFVPYVHDLRVLVVGEDCFAMKRIPSKGEFRANFSLGGTVEPWNLSESTKQLAINATKAIGLKIAGVDVLIDENSNESILEVNHTPGFLGMEEALGENIGKKIVEYVLKSAK